MNKYFLNFLRWITQGQVPDSILKKSFNHRLEDGKFKFSFRANVDVSDWKMAKGSCSQ